MVGFSSILLEYPIRGAYYPIWSEFCIICISCGNLILLGFVLLNRNKNYRNGLAGSLLGRVCAVVVLIALNGFFNVSYGEIGMDISGYTAMVSNNANKAFSEPGELTQIASVPSPLEKQTLSDKNSGESLYLAVYLNHIELAEIVEAKEKGGSVYFNLNEITLLLEAAVTEDANAVATPEQLAKIFPAEFTYSENLQTLLIKGTGKLPVEKRWQREHLQKMLSYNAITENTPILNFEYGLLGPPSLDISASYFRNGEERFNYSFKGGMEAMYGTAQFFGRGRDDDELTNLRVSWERLNKDWFIRVGDVVAPPINLVAQAEVGRGFSFSTFPVENATQFDSETISGDLLDGWEVELYRGQVLLDFRKSDGSGRFIFRDIPLLYGQNNIVLKFYGPQGQFREETRPVNIGGRMAPEGKLWTRFSSIDQGNNIFLGRDKQTRSHIKGYRGFGEFYYGVTPRLTMTGSLTSFMSGLLERRLIGKTGLLASYFGSSLKLDLLADDKGGFGLQSAFLRNIMGWGVQYNHVEFYNFRTDREPNLKRRRTLRINKGFGKVFLELSAEQRVDTFNVTRYEYKGKMSGSINRFILTHELNAKYGGIQDVVRGKFLATGRINPQLLLRSNINYQVKPTAELINVGGTMDYKPRKDLTLRLNVTKNMVDKKDYVISQSLLWEGKKLGLGVTGSYSDTGEYHVMASVSFSLSPDSTGTYQVNRNPSTNIGTVNVRVFLDHDQDGIYNSEIDELLEDVRLENRTEESSKNGMIAVKGPAYRLTRVKIDENTLPDLFMVSPEPVAVRPRPSHINTMNIPVWETGEIEGRAEPGDLIELIEDGRVIDSTRAEFDGFFLFEKVRFKRYKIRNRQHLQKVEVNRSHPIVQVAWRDTVRVAQK